ncbi:DNA polymerase Y family protein [Gryllotalpicola kribbensis]|uniref:DNA polymerase Y family protein n=1 Tax=Gryllotalpicola kribbensis TaxID=993084 RepID=A0ABP8AZI2_9MICO
MSAGAGQGALTRSIVLWCPDWPIRAALLKYPSIAEGDAIALIEKGLVFACSAAARAAGVRRGLRVREAQARCPELVVLPYDPQADARFFEPLLAAVEQTVPGVQPIRPGMCALRSRGPARYYGGEVEAAEVLLGVLADHGVPDARAGVADGPFAAEQAARHPSTGSAERAVLVVSEGGSPAFLAALPVAAMGDEAFTALCRRLGLNTLGALAGMAADELVERFGVTGARVHALVTGRDAQVVVPRAPQRALERRLVFDEGLDRVDQLAFAARQTADDVIAGLTEAKLVATAVTVTIQTEDGAESSRTWLHPRWFTAADLVDRLRWQLQGVGPGTGALEAPVVQLVFAPESVDAAHHHEQGLWGDAPDERVHHALSRVQSMLGHDAVVTPALGGGRLLDDRQVMVPWGDRSPAGTAERAAQPWPGALPDPLPATVFLPRVRVSLLTDSGEPVSVSDRGLALGEPALFAYGPGARPIGSHAEALRLARPITGWAGPWTVDERWWDAQAARRVHRFSVVDADGIAWLLLFDGETWLAEARYD